MSCRTQPPCPSALARKCGSLRLKAGGTSFSRKYLPGAGRRHMAGIAATSSPAAPLFSMGRFSWRGLPASFTQSFQPPDRPREQEDEPKDNCCRAKHDEASSVHVGRFHGTDGPLWNSRCRRIFDSLRDAKRLSEKSHSTLEP